MDCSLCKDLERAFVEVRHEYLLARTSVSYHVSTELAAEKYVDMQRARYELEEHLRNCAQQNAPALLPERALPVRAASASQSQWAA